MPPSQGPGSQTLPQPPVPPATKFGPRAPGLSSAKPLKPQGLGPKPQPGPPPAPWVGQAKPRPGLASVAAGTGPKQPGREPGPEPGQGNTLRPAARPWAARQEPAASPSEGQRHQAALAPAFQHKPTWNRTEQKERPTVPEPPKLEQGSVPSLKAEEPAPFSYKDVEELENLARQFMQEMDSHPKIETLPAETCSRCGKDLARSQAAVKAMGKMFHVECFTCSRCRQELKGQQFYEVDHEPLCESCHSTTLDKCVVCQQPITERLLRATGKTFHPKCFTCVQCKKVLEGQPFIVDNKNQVYCVEDYHRAFAPKCSVCNEPIVPEDGKEEAVRIIALDKNFHVKCYRCEDCERSLSSEADEDG
uniref:zyxin-like n=1 Tax=Pristiophorus japonicus TaxID=55135 RepID=UPI00398E4581